MAKLDTLTLRQEAAKKILNGEVSDKVLESIMKEDIAFSTTVLRSVDILVDGKVVPHETTAKEVFDYVKKSPYYDALMEEFKALVADGTVAGGMIPKLENSFNAIEHGVKQVVITLASSIDGKHGTILRG